MGDNRYWVISDESLRFALQSVAEGVTPEQAYAVLGEHAETEPVEGEEQGNG